MSEIKIKTEIEIKQEFDIPQNSNPHSSSTPDEADDSKCFVVPGIVDAENIIECTPDIKVEPMDMDVNDESCRTDETAMIFKVMLKKNFLNLHSKIFFLFEFLC